MSMQRELVDEATDVAPRKEPSRRAGALVGVVLVVALIVGAAALLQATRPEPSTTDGRSGSLHLPTVVNAPGTWSDAEGPTGPLAALGIAARTRPEGLTGDRQSMELFGVSAEDGRSTWIDLPGVDVDDVGYLGWFALSPDGRWIGWARFAKHITPNGRAPLLGWSVMDTTNRQIREFTVNAAPLRATMADLGFSGDSQYLLTSYEKPTAPETRGHQFVAWDVHSGTPTVLEKPGHYWLPSLGSAPTDVTWSRGRTVYRANPATGSRSAYSVPQSVLTASWAPDDTAFAYIGHPAENKRGTLRLYAGRTLDRARDHALPLDVEPHQLLGWRDSRHVVVGHYRDTVQIVDVVTGDVDELDMAGQGQIINSPLLAADLWRNPLVAPAAREGTTDPRRPLRWAGWALLAILAGTVLVRRLRARC